MAQRFEVAVALAIFAFAIEEEWHIRRVPHVLKGHFELFSIIVLERESDLRDKERRRRKGRGER